MDSPGLYNINGLAILRVLRIRPRRPPSLLPELRRPPRRRLFGPFCLVLGGEDVQDPEHSRSVSSPEVVRAETVSYRDNQFQ